MDLDQMTQVIPVPVEEWGPREVGKWLQFVQLPQLCEVFEEWEIDGERLMQIDNEFLAKKLKIDSSLIRRKLLKWSVFLDQKREQIASMIHDLLQSLTSETGSVIKSLATKVKIPRRKADWCRVGPYSLIISQSRNCKCVRSDICAGEDVTIGRASFNSYQISTQNTNVALYHCRITHIDGWHYVEAVDKEVWAKIDQRIEIGQEIVIDMGLVDMVVSAQRNRLSVKARPGGEENEFLQWVYEGEEERRIQIGRIYGDLLFPNQRQMSARHGKFTFFQDRWHYEDLGSWNSSWLKCSVPHLITQEMTIRLGKSKNVLNLKLVKRAENLTKSQQKELEEKNQCKMCESERNCFFRPCNHCVCCFECSHKLEQCPECLREFEEVVKFYRN